MGSGIYKILNTVNGKFYIGSAIKFYDRFHIHKSHLNNNKHHSRHLQRAYNKYGSDAFEFHIIEIIKDATKEKLLEREQYYLDILKPHYNIRLIADSNLGIKRSDETKKKQSLLKLGKVGPRLGAVVSQETRDKISKTLFGRKHTEETKIKIGLASKARPSNRKGTKWTVEQKIKKKKLDKWPHELGIKCKCSECLEKHAAYHRARRLRIKNAARLNNSI